MYTVFDIDGVVADVSHRLHHLEPPHRSWHEFHAEAERDPVLATGRALAEQASEDGEVIWLTGRPAWARQLTRHWLDEADLPSGELIMRDDEDYRPAKIIKAEALRTLARRREDQLITLVDDDPAVVDAATAAGFPALLATWLPRRDPRRDALAAAQERFGRA